MTHEELKKRKRYWTAERIFKLRRRLKLGQKAFGNQLGYSPKRAKISVSELENGHRKPSLNTIVMLEQLRHAKKAGA